MYFIFLLLHLFCLLHMFARHLCFTVVFNYYFSKCRCIKVQVNSYFILATIKPMTIYRITMVNIINVLFWPSQSPYLKTRFSYWNIQVILHYLHSMPMSPFSRTTFQAISGIKHVPEKISADFTKQHAFVKFQELLVKQFLTTLLAEIQQPSLLLLLFSLFSADVDTFWC